MKLTVRRQIRPGVTIAQMRERSARNDRRIGSDVGNCTLLEVGDAPVPVTQVCAPHTSEHRSILYFHGGGFCTFMPNTYRKHAARIANETGATVFLVQYGLAPEQPIGGCFDDAFASYEWLLERGVAPDSILIAGDSAGGGLALRTCQRARDSGLPLPAGQLLLSPGLDATFDNPSMRENDGIDPMMRRAGIAWLRDLTVVAGQDLTDSAISPGRGSMAGLPSMRIDVGTTELLRDDARNAVRKSLMQGSEALLREWTSMPHGFQLFPWLPETRLWLREAASFAERCWTGKGIDGSNRLRV